MGTTMPKAKAQVGQRWLIENMGPVKKDGRRASAWRVIVAIQHHKKQGRLYGVRDGKIPEYPLGPVSGCRDRGRFLRSRSLIRRDKRIHPAYLTSQTALQNQRQLVAVAKAVLCPQEGKDG